jgi:hypothetical protein
MFCKCNYGSKFYNSAKSTKLYTGTKCSNERMASLASCAFQVAKAYI